MTHYEPRTSLIDERKVPNKEIGHDASSACENAATAFVPAASLQPGCHVVTGVGVCEVVSVRMTVMGRVRVECQLADGRTMFTGYRPDELVEVKEQADASTN